MSTTPMSLIEAEVSRLEKSAYDHAYATNYAEGMVSMATVTLAISFDQADHFSHRIDAIRRARTEKMLASIAGRKSYAN